MWNLKYDTNINETETLTDEENRLVVTKGERGKGRDKLGVWINYDKHSRYYI